MQLPYSGSNNTVFTYTCSVDALWTGSIYSGEPVGDVYADYTQTATIQNIRPPAPIFDGYQYTLLLMDDSTWRRLQIDLDWLNTLIPPLTNIKSGYISLAALLTDMGIDNSTGIIVNWGDVSSVLEAVVAALVADDMSRQG